MIIRKEKKEIDDILSNNLPVSFLGFTTNYGEGDSIGVRHAKPIEKGPVKHFVELYTIKSYLQKRLGIDSCESLSPEDWLKLDEQRLLETVSGEVFVDLLGTVEEMRKTLKYYPEKIWVTKLANEWQKISENEAFVGRCGDVGDDLGSRLVAGIIIKRIMTLCFLMEKKYSPYEKWFGSAFKKLNSSDYLLPIFEDVLNAQDWKKREDCLSKAYEKIAEMHNSLNITEKLPDKVQDYFGRPYKVTRADVFAEKIRELLHN